MTEISVKTKLWSLIAIMLLLIISVGAVGFVTLERGAATLKEFVHEDEAFQNLTDRVHLHIIQLRRFEKDYFLNIGNPEKQQDYLKKYQAIDAGMPQLLTKLANLARTDVHLAPDLQAKVAALPGLYADYRDGFYATVRQLRNDPNLTPQQANVLMAKFKADIPVLEADMAAVAAGRRPDRDERLGPGRQARPGRPDGYRRGGLGRRGAGRPVGRGPVPLHLPGHLPGRPAPHVPPDVI